VQRFSLGLATTKFFPIPLNNLFIAEFRGSQGDSASAFNTGVNIPTHGQFHHVVATYDNATRTLLFYYDTLATVLSSNVPPVPGARLDLNAGNNPRAGSDKWENLGAAGGYLSVEPVGNPSPPAFDVDGDQTGYYSTASRKGGNGSFGRVARVHNGSGRLGEPSLFLQNFTLEVWA
jgi:hypothetical protein